MVTHLYNDILRHGLPRVYYGGVGENMLKEKNKRFARRAKKTEEHFELTTAIGDVENILISKATHEIDSCRQVSVKQERKGLHFLMKRKEKELVFTYSRSSWKKLTQGWKGSMTLNDFENFVRNIPLKENRYIEFFTEYTWDGFKIRGHPFYRKEAWQDWVVAEYGGKEVKVQVLLFMNIAEDCLFREIESELSCSGEAGKYALVH